MTRTIMIVFLLALMTASCRREEAFPGAGSDTAATSATSTAAATPAVTVTLTEYRIDMPSTAPTGSRTFLISNTGKEKHSFEIEGQGLEQSLPSALDPGQSGTMEVKLEPGTYKVYCPVEGHEEKGMTLQLTVQ